MKVKFCGAARHVTGSSHLITLDNGYKILLDCGLYQGTADEMRHWNKKWPYFDPKDIDFLIVSHAHIDHTGRIPKLVKDGFEGTILCTHATRDLCTIMLMDSAKIQEDEAENGLNSPLYNTLDVYTAMHSFTSIDYEKWHNVTNGVRVLFRDAGHILGSASITLEIEEEGKKLVRFGFTGDIGRPDRPILRDPIPMPEVDYLICESTYGNRRHSKKFTELNELLEVVNNTCVKNKGKLLIPAFSIGRTQELVYMLDQLSNQGKLPRIPIYVDSPLAISAMHIFQTHPECFDQELHEYMLKDPNPFGFEGLNYTRRFGLADRLKESKEPCIIISAAGMMNAGRVQQHLYNILEDAKNTVLVIGYCPPSTLGGQIRRGDKNVMLMGDWISIKATINIMDSFSAHGDQQEMFDFIKNQTTLKKLFLTHGEYDSQQEFRTFLGKKGFENITIPELGQVEKID
ncbi:MAG: MBL fold metallo-hydrolase [Aureispira sp.]|nr:MBL fold metallo-hydrolase [Aureispira sp.]